MITLTQEVSMTVVRLPHIPLRGSNTVKTREAVRGHKVLYGGCWAAMYILHLAELPILLTITQACG